MNGVASMNHEDTMTDWLQLIRAEYHEIPGLHLTKPQVQRLWNLDADVRPVTGGARNRTIPAPHARRWVHQSLSGGLEHTMTDTDLQRRSNHRRALKQALCQTYS